MKSLKQLLQEKKPGDRNRFVTHEFQDYAYRLAKDLGDELHTPIYMRLAKTMDRAILETCRRFVIDSNAKNKGALFMWKLKQIRLSATGK